MIKKVRSTAAPDLSELIFLISAREKGWIRVAGHLSHRAVFVGQRDNQCGKMAGRDQGERPHMAANDLRLKCIDTKVALRVLRGTVRVKKTVERRMSGQVPVIEKKIMQQGAADQ